MPEVALAPDQSPLAVQEVALVDDQVRVEDPLYATEVGLAEIVTVGAGIAAVVNDTSLPYDVPTLFVA